MFKVESFLGGVKMPCLPAVVCVVDRRVVNQKRVKNRYLFIMVVDDDS